MDFETVEISQKANYVWKDYCDIFHRRWGIDREEAAKLGLYGKRLATAEFTEHGASAYSTSVMQPIRNAYYNSGIIDSRWEQLRKLGLETPLLDYGCGVGFTLLWLERSGFKDLYGHELEGVTKNVASEAFKKHGIKWMEKGSDKRFKTVLCLNVLEHMEYPVDVLRYLRSLGDRVIANICMDRHEEQHVAPESELKKCLELLKQWGTGYEA